MTARNSGTTLDTSGWLPIVLCPTDGVDRVLLLPDGREVTGAHHSPGGWRVAEAFDYEQTIYERPARGGVLPMDLRPRQPDPTPVPVGKRAAQMVVHGSLPEGVYPTHFRPNDTVYGAARPKTPQTEPDQSREDPK